MPQVTYPSTGLVQLIRDDQYEPDPHPYPQSLARVAHRRLVTEDGGRAPGLHVSGIIKHIKATIDPATFNKPVNPDPELAAADEAVFHARIRMGLLFEDVLSQALVARVGPDRYARPGQFQLHTPCGPIIGTPDIVDVLDWVVEEWKATWLSMGHLDRDGIGSPKFWHWLVQLMAYCHMLDTNTGRLRVLFINGNYKRDDPLGSGPQFRTVQLVFTPQELADNWRMLESHGKQLLAMEARTRTKKGK